MRVLLFLLFIQNVIAIFNNSKTSIPYNAPEDLRGPVTKTTKEHSILCGMG